MITCLSTRKAEVNQKLAVHQHPSEVISCCPLHHSEIDVSKTDAKCITHGEKCSPKLSSQCHDIIYQVYLHKQLASVCISAVQDSWRWHAVGMDGTWMGLKFDLVRATHCSAYSGSRVSLKLLLMVFVTTAMAPIHLMCKERWHQNVS